MSRLLLLSVIYILQFSSTKTSKPHPENKEQCESIINYNYNTEESHCTKIMVVSKKKLPSCRNTTQCPMKSRHTVINYTTPVWFMSRQIFDMFALCCGDCNLNQKIVDDISKLFENESTLLKSSDIVYPVFGSQASPQLYGFWFIPFMPVPPGLYIVRRKSREEITNEVMSHIIKLWPLFVILIVFAMLAGVVAWFIESWTNKEEFSRSFVVGLLDGFWWAYIAMTTGDVVFIWPSIDFLMMCFDCFH